MPRKRKRKFVETIARVVANDSQLTTVDFESQPLTGSQIVELVGAVETNKRVRKIYLSTSVVDVHTSSILANAFLASVRLRYLKMPLIFYPGQQKLDEFKDDILDGVETYNYAAKSDARNFLLFAFLNTRGFKAMNGKYIPDLSMQRIEEFAVPLSKQLKF